jgi:putative RNA 2'-phosphotransferase
VNEAERARIGKYLSYVLRHRPDAIGLDLDAGGWCEVSELLRCAAADGRELTREMVDEVVASDDKERFAVSDDGLRLRASQGHSIPVDLGLSAVAPPERLFHGTARRFLDSILREGLRPGSRQFVHLSPDGGTAVKVGRRHGKPVVLAVDAAGMAAAGREFFLSENGVWMTAGVPPEFLRVVGDE